MEETRVHTLLKGLLLTAVSMVGMIYVSTQSLAVHVNYDTAVEAVYTESYNEIALDPVQGSPLETVPMDGVDPSTGKLTLLREDLSLEGMAGMDLKLARYYDSKKAQIGKAIAEEKSNFAMDTVRVAFKTGNGEQHEIVVNTAIYEKHKDALKDMFVSYEKAGEGKYTTEEVTQQTKLIQSSQYNVYGISTGWAFDFPWIETMILDSDTTEIPMYLHYGSIGSMRIATDENNNITGFRNYNYQDFKLENFNQTVDGVACRYLLRDKTGLRTYFNKDGVVVLQKDNHDNAIRFTYRDKIYFDAITDSVGRNVKFDYTESAHGILLLQKVTVEGQKTAGGVSKKTVTYKSSETSYESIRGNKMYGAKLNSVTVDGTKENYTYDTVESLANTSGAGVASQRAVTNETYLLVGAEEDGCIQKFEYRAGAIRSPKINSSQSRNVVTQHYYVTREYKQASGNSKKKTNGRKYDYFQKQTDSKGNSQFVSYDDLDDEKYEMQAYGTDNLQCMTLVSAYNPNKKQKTKKFTDYVFAEKDINTSTLQLKKKPKKSTVVYVYNTNRLPVSETVEEKRKMQTEYTYDQSGAGSLITLQTQKDYGTKRTGKASVTKEGFTYDAYRNLLTVKAPKAYQKKYQGKEHLFTTTYSYHGGAYPKEDKPYVLNQKKTYETYEDKNTKCREEYFLASNQIDMNKMNKYISQNNAAYRLLDVKDIIYDKYGNITLAKNYPDYSTEGFGNVIENKNQYNQMGQVTKKEISAFSEKHPQQNQSYVQQEMALDSFGNVIRVKDSKGLMSVNTYDEEKNEISSTVSAKDTIYETESVSAHTEDNSKRMDLDFYGRCTVTISDDFGNVIISKNERTGTWTESDYVYGDGEEDDEEDEENESSAESQLVEERTYSFEPKEAKFTTNDKGEREYNYDIKGRGEEILSGTRYIYNDDNEEIVTAEFSGGAMDADHCSSWTLTKVEDEIDEDGNEISTVWTKEINPQYYQQDVDQTDYYNQFDKYMLSETVSETITDEEGNDISEKTTYTANGSREVNEILAAYDEFGNRISETETVQVTEKGKTKNKSEIISSYKYDYRGNIIEVEEKSRKNTNEPWEITTTKAGYDDQGRVVESYDPKGIEEGYATRYEYDIFGQLIKEMIPVDKKNDAVIYQINTMEYDEDGNIIAEENQQSDNAVQRTEYTYDIMGQLVQAKEMQDGKSALYAQYMYDREGNKIRQFTGLTKPLTLTLKEGDGDNCYTYMGHNYYIEVSGKAKKDVYSETKYNYNKKDELISYTDPEGNEENYTYDVYGNLVKMTDRNGNIFTKHYDFQNRIISEQAEEKETKKKTNHIYEYDAYGNTSKIDNREFVFDDINGEIKTETIRGENQKTVKKSYEYDSDGAATSFDIKVGNKTKLAFDYEYDGESKLKKVKQTDGDSVITIASYEYDANGTLLREDGQKVSTTYNFNPDGTLKRMVNNSKDGVLLSGYDAIYQKNAQETKETEEVRGTDGITKKSTSEYSYDRMGRLTKESHTGAGDICYTYDAHNNRKEMITEGQIISYKYNKNDELVRTDTLNKKTERDQVTLYKQDKNGNRLATVNRKKIEKTKEGPQFDLNVTLGDNRLNENVVNHYDAYGQNTEILTKNHKVHYTYDEEGLRTSKTVNGKKTLYVWDGDQLVMELDTKGNVKRRYVRGQNLAYTDEGAGTKKQYYVFDLHGSVVQLINEDGSIARRYMYDAFGNEEKPDKKDDNPFRYCGEYYDKETGTIYLRSRSYDAETGRFLTADTYKGEEEDISSLNLYTYCNNDSINMVDPTGHWGRHKENGKPVFTHKYMTKKVYPKVEMAPRLLVPNPYYKNIPVYKKEIILDGTLLPDFVNSDEEGKKKYREEYIWPKSNDYKVYETKTVYGYYLKLPKKKGDIYKEDETTQNIFHGKSYKEVDNLKREAEIYVVKADRHIDDIREKYLFVGCVLHSIQDYYAHSYVSDLQDFKGDSKGSSRLQKVRAYHKDWAVYYKKMKKIEKKYKKMKLDDKKRTKKDAEIDAVEDERDKIHSKTKDNPYSQFVQGKNGNWYWKKKNGKKKNKMYNDACTDTQQYLNRILWKLF